MFPSPDEANGVLFLSDVHLGGFSEERNRAIEQELIHLTEYCHRHRYRICILGDLFDYWMEYRGVAPSLGERLLELFRSWNHPFHPTLFITGNHDHWTGPLLPSIGFRLEHGAHRMELGGKNLLLMHGDGLPDHNRLPSPESGGSLELRRPLLHRILRNPLFIRGYQAVLPPAAGIRVMRWFSRINRSLDNVKGGTGTLDRWSARFLERTETDLVLCGHDHVPRANEYRWGTFMNLGTFYRHRTAVLYTKGEFSHVQWNDDSKTLTTWNPITEDE